MAPGTTRLLVDHARPFVEVHFPESDRRALAWLDTGGGAFIVGQALGRDLALEPTVEEIDGEQHETIEIPHVTVAERGLNTSAAIAVRFPGDLITEGFAAEAFIPARVLAQHNVVFDYRGGTFSLDAEDDPIGTRVDAPSFPPPGTAWPAVTVNLAGEYVHLLLDTGASCCMLSDKLLERLEAKVSARTPGAFGFANMSAGPLDTQVETVRLPDLTWGDVHVPSVIAVSRPEGNFERMMSSGMPVPVEGAIAGNVLRHLRVEWRASDHAVWLDGEDLPTEQLCQVPVVLFATEGAMRITRLGESAEAMGLRVGDELVSVDGVAVSGFGATVELLRGSPGERRNLELRRDGENVTVDTEVVEVV